MGYRAAARWTCSAIEMAPSAMSFTAVPEAKAPPPVETWMMPSLLLSASPSARRSPSSGT